jgi:acyl-CoA hydrolase
MSAKTVEDSKVTITELMIPSYANFRGKVHGGLLLSMMDKVAYACAAKYSGCYCVTVAVERVEFLAPVSLTASVHWVGRSSMIIGIRVDSLVPSTGVTRHTNSCLFTMVAKDAEGQPTAVPTLIVENTQQARQFLRGSLIKEISKREQKLMNATIDQHAIKVVVDACTRGNCEFPDSLFL